MQDLDSSQLDELLEAVGAHLEQAGEAACIVVVGGTSLAVRGWVPRTTQDVDVIAQGRNHKGARVLISATPLPAALVLAVQRVAEDYGLPPDWMNTVIGAQFDFGLPPGFLEEVAWHVYGPLEVGFAGRSSLIALKLFAVVDAGIDTVHFQDLMALDPSAAELVKARTWVSEQDAGPAFPKLVSEVLENVERRLGRGGAAG